MHYCFVLWSTTFVLHSDRPFKESDAFIGFQKDTPAAVVFQATNHLKSLQSGSSGTATCSRAAAHLPIFGVTSSEELTHEVGDSERLKDGVSGKSQGWKL